VCVECESRNEIALADVQLGVLICEVCGCQTQDWDCAASLPSVPSRFVSPTKLENGGATIARRRKLQCVSRADSRPVGSMQSGAQMVLFRCDKCGSENEIDARCPLVCELCGFDSPRAISLDSPGASLYPLVNLVCSDTACMHACAQQGTCTSDHWRHCNGVRRVTASTTNYRDFHRLFPG
jgi:hypothetical protein